MCSITSHNCSIVALTRCKKASAVLSSFLRFLLLTCTAWPASSHTVLLLWVWGQVRLESGGLLQPYFAALIQVRHQLTCFNRLSAVAALATVGLQYFYWFWDFAFVCWWESLFWCDRYLLNLWTYFWAALSHTKTTGKDNTDSPLHDGEHASMQCEN